MIDKEKLRTIIKEVESNTPCRCDLDNWEPEITIGHSTTCPIHKEVERRLKGVGDGRG